MTTDEARAYEKLFVPALFGPWAKTVAETARLHAGDRVLDVACGTGVLARTVAAKVKPDGSVVGLDPDEAMLSVAREISRDVEWRRGTAESLPFEDQSFDAVVSQFGLMFFSDQSGALRQMRRVLRPGGRLVVAVWGPLERAPGFAALVALLQRLFGAGTADRLRAAFSLGDPKTLAALLQRAGTPAPTITTRAGHARFTSLKDWVQAEARGWLALDDQKTKKLMALADRELHAFAAADGSVSLDISAHIVSATTASL